MTQNALLVCAALLAVLLGGCSRGGEPSTTVEICVEDAKGLTQLLALMHQLAADHHMMFIDNSARTSRELKVVAQNDPKVPISKRLINVGIEGNGGLGVTAGNMGLSTYQVALGFTDGPDATESKRFTNSVIQALSKQWKVAPLPPSRGVKPSPNCA